MDRDIAQKILEKITSVKTTLQAMVTNSVPTPPAASLSNSPATLGDTRTIEDMPDAIQEEPEDIQEEPEIVTTEKK